MGVRIMTYDEALQALNNAQVITWSKWASSQEITDVDIEIHDGLTQAIEVFKQMKIDLMEYEKLAFPQGHWDGVDKTDG